MLSQRVVNLITKKYQFRVEVDQTSLTNNGRPFQLGDATYYDLVVSLTMGLMDLPHALPLKIEVVGTTTTRMSDVCGFLSEMWPDCDESARHYIMRNWQVRDPQNDRPEIYVN